MIIQGTLLWFILDKYLGTFLSVAAFRNRAEVCDEAFLWKQSKWLMAVLAEELHRLCLTEF